MAEILFSSNCVSAANQCQSESWAKSTKSVRSVQPFCLRLIRIVWNTWHIISLRLVRTCRSGSPSRPISGHDGDTTSSQNSLGSIVTSTFIWSIYWRQIAANHHHEVSFDDRQIVATIKWQYQQISWQLSRFTRNSIYHSSSSNYPFVVVMGCIYSVVCHVSDENDQWKFLSLIPVMSTNISVYRAIHTRHQHVIQPYNCSLLRDDKSLIWCRPIVISSQSHQLHLSNLLARCVYEKHPLTFSSISSSQMRRYKQKLQWMYLRNSDLTSMWKFDIHCGRLRHDVMCKRLYVHIFIYSSLFTTETVA